MYVYLWICGLGINSDFISQFNVHVLNPGVELVRDQSIVLLDCLKDCLLRAERGQAHPFVPQIPVYAREGLLMCL